MESKTTDFVNDGIELIEKSSKLRGYIEFLYAAKKFIDVVNVFKIWHGPVGGSLLCWREEYFRQYIIGLSFGQRPGNIVFLGKSKDSVHRFLGGTNGVCDILLTEPLGA